jgi:hypothetical protein
MDQPTQTEPALKWRLEKQAGPEYAPKRPNKSRRIFTAVAGILAMAGLIGGLLSWLTPLPRPTLLALYVNEWQTPEIPFPAQALQDQQALLQNPSFSTVLNPSGGGPQRHMLVRELSFLKDKSVGNTVFIYLSAPACFDSAGKVAILAGNSDPNNPSTWLRLEEVLQQVAACRAEHKLLILDLMRPLCGNLPGILSDDVAAAMECELQEVPDAGRLTLCSASPGQVSLSSQVAERSIFSLYLEEGLRGAADGWGPTGKRDSRITASELAAFVRLRVERWAKLNRDARQTPVLYGDVDHDDFTVAGVDAQEEPFYPPVPTAAKYPDWLKEAWKQRDLALAIGSWRWTPRTFRRLEAWLLKAEEDWRHGLDDATLQAVHQQQLKQLTALADKTRTFPGPEPYSLAMGLALGDRDDKEANKSVNELFAKLRTLKAGDPTAAKAVEEFSEKSAKLSPFVRQAAVFQQAMAETEPTRERVALLQQLLRDPPDQRPRFVETLVLKRLGEWSAKPEAKIWPTEVVRRLLLATGRGETATSQYEVHSWNASLLAEADQLRHDAEVLFWSRGFAPLAEADDLFGKAAAQYALASRRADILLEARAVLDDAMLLLPAYQRYLESVPSWYTPWALAAGTAAALDHLLNDPAPQGTSGLRSIDGIQDAGDVLKRQLVALRQPFAADVVQGLVQRSKLTKADVAAIGEIQVLLTTPFLKAEDRVALWQASMELEQRLHQLTMRLDREEDEAREQTVVPEGAGAGATDPEEMEPKEVRAAASIQLLELAGLPTGQLESLKKQMELTRTKQFDLSSTAKLSQLLREAWTRHLTGLLQTDLPASVLDRISRVLPALEVFPEVDDLPLSLPARMRLSEAKGLWKRLGERFRYESRDYAGAKLDWSPYSSGERFFAQAALVYQPQPVVSPHVDMTIGAGAPRLSPGREKGNVSLNFDWATPTKGADEGLDLLLRPGDPAWLEVDPSKARVPSVVEDPAYPLSRKGTFGFDVRLLPGDDALRGPSPRGILVEANLEGRHYHFKAPVSVKMGPDQPHLLLSTNSKAPNPPLSEIHLRAGKVRTPFYLFLNNPSDTARKVVVEIKAGETPFKGGTIAKTLPPNSIQRLNLAEAGPLPATDLPDFSGPLTWRVLDADPPNEVLDEQAVSVHVGSPRDYVRVTNILFVPQAPKIKNQLTLTGQVFSPPGGAGIPVELVLPADRIPGLLSVGKGNLMGTLPAVAGAEKKTLELNAEKIILTDAEEEDGVVYLNVDGYERAFTFRVTFARAGEPTTPRGDFRPAVRLRVARFVKADAKFVLPIEVDNPPEGASLELTIGARIAGEFKGNTPPKSFDTAKRERLGFSPSPDGALVFEGTLQDWVVPLDTSRLFGRQELQCRMLDRSGKEIAKVVQTMIVADSKPEGVKILDAPRLAKFGSKVVLRAVASHEEGGIKEALFFVGRPVEDKLPKDIATFKAVPTDKSKTTWQAEIALPESRKGPTDVTVQVTNQVGFSAYATATIELVDYDPATQGPGKIKGKVMQGTLEQPGLEVSLRDLKGAELAKAKTKADGTFIFEEVAPGRYTVYCRKQEAQRHGTSTVVVRPNETSEVTVSMVLRVTK